MTMINVTIKTLDSQNHLHIVPDDITVKEFKERIASSVSVPADKQRLIYCGRVLQDDKKLSEYNVHEKVVHLVMRAPPQSSGRSGGQGGASTSGGQASHHHHPIHMHHHHHHRRGNNGDGGQVLFGSFMHPEDAEPLTQGPSSSGVRLNQARSMLGRAAAVLDQLDNSSSTTTASAAASSSGAAMQSQSTTSGQATRVESNMETESSGGNTTATSQASSGDAAVVSPTQDIDAFFSEMDALNSMDPSLIGETPRGPPPMPPPNMMGGFGGSLAGGLAQAASAAVASALSSMTRMPMPPPASTMPSQGTVRRHAVRITSRSGSPSIRIQSTSSAGNASNPPSAGNASNPPSSAASNQATNTSTNETTSQPGTNTSRPTSGGTQETTQSEQGADNDGETGPSLRLEHPRCSVMVEVLDLYRTVQQRLQPHLQRYYNLMSTDPSFESSESEMRNEQWMLSRVAEVLHFISHAVHAISDIMVDLRRAPPRQLRARPIIIQQPALVQAQINVTTGTDPLQAVNLRNSAQAPSTATTATTAPTSTANPSTPAPSSTVPTATSTSTSSSNVYSSSVSSASPITVTPTASSSSSPTSTAPSAPSAPTSTASRIGIPGSGMWSIGGGSGFPMDSDGVVFMHVGPNGITIDSVTTDENNQGGGQDPTPELIENLVSSIASQLEVRLGSMNPSYSTQSSVPSSEESTTTTSASISSSSTSTAPNQSQGAQNRSHNSQAAGNSGTNTTNSTHTRVSHRPHVHVTPLNVPGMGMNQFDPFLPCQSHHIRPHARRRHHAHDQTQNSASQAARRRHQAATQTQEATTGGSTSPSGPQVGVSPTTSTANNPLALFTNLMAEMLSQPQQQQQQQSGQQDQQSGQQQEGSGNSEGPEPAITDQMFGQLVQGVVSQMSGMMNNEGGVTQQHSNTSLHDFLLPFAGGMFAEGEEDSIFYQLFNTVSQSLSIGDLLQLFFGRTPHVNQLQEPLQQFVNNRVLHGQEPTEDNLNLAIDEVIQEIHPYLVSTANDAQVQEGIDYVNTVHNFIRHRLHDMFNLVLNHRDTETFGVSLVSLVRRSMGELLALSLHCFTDGAQGLERVLQERVRSIMSGVNPVIQAWSVNTSLMQLRSMMSRMTINDDHIRRYVVSHDEGRRMEQERQQRREAVNAKETSSSSTTEQEMPSAPPAEPSGGDEGSSSSSSTSGVAEKPATEPSPATGSGGVEEPMEVDEVGGEVVVTTEREGAAGGEEEAAVNVQVGSQSWHSSVPQEWIPVITRDVERQRRGVPDTVFSDAYLCGMPIKRRKLATNAKPHGSVEGVIQDTLRQSMRGVGAPRAVTEAIVNDAGSQLSSSFVGHVRASLRGRLKDNKDFEPEKFPKSDENINKKV
ncbi:uncharacterized protein LOC143033267 isoform X2 [Oratosquilla oratoria]